MVPYKVAYRFVHLIDKTNGNAEIIEEMKIIFERAKLLIMVIFPKSVKSLEDQTLGHFSRATKFFSKLSFVEASKSHEKEIA